MASGDQFLEHLAEHFRVHSHFYIERCRLHHREVEAVKQPFEDLLNGTVGYDYALALIQLGLLE